jgi:NodT family efflux transporter outer membrane factor (OMF) lipoprotein
MKTLYAAVSALALAGCTVGPDYVRPVTPSSAAAPFIGSTSPAVSTAAVDGRWWQLYQDPILDRLIADALAANTDIRVAVARLERARAGLRGARSNRLPQTGIDASGSYGRVAESQTPAGADRDGWNVDVGLNVAYEVDLFGRVRRSIEAANGDVGAAEADAEAVRITVVTDTTRAYADAAAAAERIAVAQQIVDLLDQSVRITSGRFEAGRASRLDIIRISTLRDQRKAAIPELAAQRNAALFRLATLTGRTPSDLPADAAVRSNSLRLDRPIPVGDGSALLARRPDVRAAERRLAADTARIGVATADLYPNITLGGSIGSTGAGLGDLFGAGPFNWLLGPLISWAFPNQEPARARIAASRADVSASLATFDGTVLRALEETETALSAYRREIERHAALATARDEAAAAARISRARQREGQLDFLTVLDAERTFADTEAEYSQSTARLVDRQIDLFRALGGTWTEPQAPVLASVN